MASQTLRPRRPRPNVPDSHLVSHLAYADEAVFEEEKQKVLGKVWRLACHESEMPDPYDYRTFDYVQPPLLMIRGGDGRIRSFVNVCSHRGAKLVNEVSGTAKQLTCFYHHWTYDAEGRCVDIPRGHAYDASGLKIEDCGLREVRTEVKLGLVFFNLDDACIPLDEFLGDAFESLEAALSEDLEVFHYSRSIINGNWKDWQSTNMDPYHELMHARVRQTAIMTDAGMQGRQFQFYPNGHARVGGMVARLYKA